MYTRYLIVVCIDSKEYITYNEPQQNTEISFDDISDFHADQYENDCLLVCCRPDDEGSTRL
jgi:hypothetical protein